MKAIVTDTKAGWKVSIIFDSKEWSRYYYYKKDAEKFVEEINKTYQRYGDFLFHPDMLHMYEEI